MSQSVVVTYSVSAALLPSLRKLPPPPVQVLFRYAQLKKIPKMSFDIHIQDLPKNATSIGDIDEDFESKPLGSKTDIIEKIMEVLPIVDFSDTTWGILTEKDFSIEFNIGNKDICEGLMLHVRGGVQALEIVDKLLKRLKLRGIDIQTGDFFDIENSSKSFSEWQKFRDKVVNL